MKTLFNNWTLNRTLAIVAGVLGFFALFAGNPYPGATATINTKELAVLIQREADHVTVEELADWIIQGRSDYRLLDLRSEAEFQQYHIPTAVNVPLAALIDYPIARNENIILYSDGGIHAAQAWLLLKARKYRGAYVLKGGLEEWTEKILFPRIAENASPEERAAFEKRKEVSKFFGGSPQTGAAAEKASPQLAMPKLDMPAAPGGTPAGAPKKKKKEGC